MHTRLHMPMLCFSFGFVALACGGSNVPAEHADTLPDSTDPEYAASFDRGEDDARVSTSRGEEGGVVVLFPRIVTSGGGDAPEATMVHGALRAIAERAAEGRPIDVRPNPERVCPRAGCLAPSVGAVVMRSGSGCAVVVTLSQAGEAPARLVAWAGEVELRNTNVAFREPPEQQIRVRDMMPCADLETAMMSSEPEIEAELRSLLGTTGAASTSSDVDGDADTDTEADTDTDTDAL